MLVAKDAIVSDDLAKKFATEKDSPYVRWVRDEGLDNGLGTGELSGFHSPIGPRTALRGDPLPSPTRSTQRPIRPKPLIPILVAMMNAPSEGRNT